MRNFPLIVSSPSGGGKTTVVTAALKKFKGAVRVVTATTRPPRKGEKPGKDYLFWTEKEFTSAVKKGHMAEWAKVFTDYYGIPKQSIDAPLKKNIIPVLVIDVQGAETVRRAYKNAVSVFLMPPNMTVLKSRILGRKGGTNNIDLRLKTAKKEIKEAAKYDYVLVNDVLSDAVQNLICIIKAEQFRNKHK